MSRTTIAVDMDDVLADAYGRIIEMYEKDHNTQLDREWMKGKAYHEAFPGGKLQVAQNYPHEEDFFEDLEVIGNSPQVMEELYAKYDVYIVSAAMEYPFSLKSKRDWLGKYFPFIHWKRIVLCGDKSIISTDYLIDDHAYNLETFTGTPLLFTALHNHNEDRFERMNSWDDVAKKFL